MALAGEDGAYRLGIALGHQLGRRKLTRRVALQNVVYQLLQIVQRTRYCTIDE